MGMASRVHRGFEAERKSFDKGDTISIRRPANFTVADAPATAEDITTETVSISLNQWKEVKFKLSDKELAWSDEKIIAEHVTPAAVAIADNIDNALLALTDTEIGVQYAQASPTPAGIAIADILGARGRLFDNGVPMQDGQLHLCIDGAAEQTLLGLSAFTQHQGAGLEGVEAQRRGSLGTKYGIEIFANQNAGGLTYTSGTAGRAAGDSALAVNNSGGYSPGSTTIVCDGGTGVETVLAGDQITFAGHSAHYTAAATGTVASGDITLTLAEGLIKSVADDEVVTVLGGETDETDPLIMFHKNAFALAMAPLPTMARELGAKVETVVDEDTGLSIRGRVYYVGNSSEVHVALDVLYGVKVLNSMYACKLLR